VAKASALWQRCALWRVLSSLTAVTVHIVRGAGFSNAKNNRILNTPIAGLINKPTN